MKKKKKKKKKNSKKNHLFDPFFQEVLQRHPLHTVGQIVYYSDSFCKSNIALKIGQVGRSVYDCYVFQCYNEVSVKLT